MTRGDKIYANFIDDYSRYSKLYLIRNKDDTWGKYLLLYFFVNKKA